MIEKEETARRTRAFLDPLGGVMRARITRHDREFYNRSIETVRADLMDGYAEIATSGSRWLVTLGCEHADDGAAEWVARFECESGHMPNASVSVEFVFSTWNAGNHVLMPSAVYAGNRFQSRQIPYSPKLWFAQDIGPDVPVIISDVPRLNIGSGPSRIQERSGSMAHPSLGFRTTTGRGFFLTTRQRNPLGDHGIGIEESRERRTAVVSITSPLVRELHSYRMCDASSPPEDEPADFREGDSVEIRFRMHAFDAPELDDLFAFHAGIRKTGPRAERRRGLPFSECLATLEEKFNRDNFVPEHGYYSVGLRQNFLQDWQIGWTGGMISTLPLLFAGGEATRENVLRNFDWLFAGGISPSGFFWDCGAHGTEWYGGDIRKPHTGNWHLIRKSADAVFYLIRQFRLMQKLGIPVKPAWSDGTRGVCEAFVRLWETQGQFGQFVDSITGEVRVGGSTSAALAPAALALAADWFAEPQFLRIALESAESFYQKFTLAGFSCGGPGDALQNPDSESSYALVESYVALFEATGETLWLDRASEAVRQFATWVVSYDFEFPAESTFGKAGVRTTGSVYANTQNKHSAPGICTMSGLALLKLFRANGDALALDFLKDIAGGISQYLPHPLQPLGDSPHGHMCERVNMTDWEGPERIGETLRMTTWAETSLMLTAVEIPGIYIRPDEGLAVSFDVAEVEVLGRENGELLVQARNPTRAQAEIRVWSESRADSLQPLAYPFLLDAGVIRLEPGASMVLRFPIPDIP